METRCIELYVSYRFSCVVRSVLTRERTARRSEQRSRKTRDANSGNPSWISVRPHRIIVRVIFYLCGITATFTRYPWPFPLQLVWMVGRGEDTLDHAYNRHNYIWFWNDDDIVRPFPGNARGYFSRGRYRTFFLISFAFQDFRFTSTLWTPSSMQLLRSPRPRCVSRPPVSVLVNVRAERAIG
jgi:hypothetical protein